LQFTHGATLFHFSHRQNVRQRPPGSGFVQGFLQQFHIVLMGNIMDRTRFWHADLAGYIDFFGNRCGWR